MVPKSQAPLVLLAASSHLEPALDKVRPSTVLEPGAPKLLAVPLITLPKP